MKTCTCVYAGTGGRDSKLRLDELGDEGDEGSDNGALGRVGQTHEQESHVAEDPYSCFGEVCTIREKKQYQQLHTPITIKRPTLKIV